MRERPNRHDWKSCDLQGSVGSNPTSSAANSLFRGLRFPSVRLEAQVQKCFDHQTDHQTLPAATRSQPKAAGHRRRSAKPDVPLERSVHQQIVRSTLRGASADASCPKLSICCPQRDEMTIVKSHDRRWPIVTTLVEVHGAVGSHRDSFQVDHAHAGQYSR